LYYIRQPLAHRFRRKKTPGVKISSLTIVAACEATNYQSSKAKQKNARDRHQEKPMRQVSDEKQNLSTILKVHQAIFYGPKFVLAAFQQFLKRYLGTSVLSVNLSRQSRCVVESTRPEMLIRKAHVNNLDALSRASLSSQI
jgi:stalled ribosome rescue protein Dom34